MAEDPQPKETTSSWRRIDVVQVIAAATSIATIVLAYLTFDLDRQREEAERSASALEKNMEQVRARIQLTTTLTVEGARTVSERLMGSTSHPVLPNVVHKQIRDELRQGRWDSYNNLMRCVYRLYPDAPTTGILGTRQIAYLEVQNPPGDGSRTIPAEDLKITVRARQLPMLPPTGPVVAYATLPELKPDSWSETTLEWSRLLPGESLLVPLAHTIGPASWSGWVQVPTAISWTNPVLGTTERLQLDLAGVAADLDFKLMASIIGNLSGSCPAKDLPPAVLR